MSLWNSFVDNIAKPVGGAIARGAEMAANYATGIFAPGSTIAGTVAQPAIQIGTSKALSSAGLTEAAQQGIKENLAYEVKNQAASNDLLLKAAVQVENKVISPIITRPVSTLGLLTDVDSPLYASDKYEKGFQLADISRAYNRSERVSMGVAATQSDLLPGFKALSNEVLSRGGVDVAKVDLWDDQNVQKNFSDNIVGRYFTGTADFIAGNAVLGGVGKLISRAGKTAVRASGLSTKGKTLEQFEKDANDGILYNVTAGERGRFTNTAEELVQVANSDDINLAINFVEKYSTNERLIDLVHKSKDPAMIRDYFLADKGYLPALERLATKAPADLAEMSDLPGYIRSRNLLNDEIYQPVGDALPRIRAAYEDAIKRNPEHARILDAFLDPDANIRSLGKNDLFPMEPVFAAQKISKGITGFRELKAAATTRDFSKIGWMEERIVGNKANGLATTLVRFAGTYKPLGFVTFSGARPFDGIVEINSAFDDVRLFKNGLNTIRTSTKETMTAAEYRNKVISDFTAAPNAAARKQVLENVEKAIAHDIARTYGFYDTTTINRLLTTMRSRISTEMNGLTQHGFGIDANGRALMVDAQTQSQLAEAYRLFPWGEFERELIRAKKNVEGRALYSFAEGMNNLYETLTKYWTFNVLARPSYIPKQSWAEPILSASLAQGSKFILDEIPSMTKNGARNFRNRVGQVVSSTFNTRQATEVNNVVNNISKRLELAIQDRDMLAAESYKFFETDLVSPKMRKDYGDIVKAELKRAERAVDELEIELQAAAKPFGIKEEIPSIASLERRIAYVEKYADSSFKAKNASLIINAKSQISKAKGELNTLIPDAKGLTAVYDDMAKVYKEIDDVILKELGEAQAERARFFGKTAEYKKRYYGKDNEYRFIGDQYVKIDGLFDENQLGMALREEFANARTVALTYAGELTVGTKNSILLRRGPRTVTDINDPLYFEELAYVGNRTFRNDPLVQQVLQEIPLERIQEWALTSPGIKYFRQFGDFTEGQIPTLVRNRVGLVKRYFPNAEARALLLQKEVTSLELSKILSKDMDRLSALHPLDFDYDMISGVEGTKGLARIERAADEAMGKVFQVLTRPENPIRWSYADKVFRDILTKKIENLIKQGVKTIDEGRVNALRQAATREALQETEKTFYTVRRKNRALWASRVLTAFPAASVNAMYRYGRFAIKNPVRTAAFLHNYQSTFKSFGVDQYGNPTDDPMKATHILVPGTKELGLMGGKGLALNARSLGFIINLPAPSYLSSVAVGTYMKDKPTTETMLRGAIGGVYDSIFPYGPQTNVKTLLLPSWAKDAYKWLNGPEGDANFLASLKSVANYHFALQEMGIEKAPSWKQMRAEAKALYGQRFFWSAFSIFGVPVKVDTRPTKVFEDYYGILMNKYLSKGMSRDDAMNSADSEFLATMAPNFPLDRITFKGSTANTYVPATASAYSRIWQDQTGLIESLGKIGQDGELVGLATLDIDASKEETSLSIYNFLKDPKTKLPDGSPLNKYALTPEQEERRRSINRTWEKYTNLRDRLDAAAQQKYGKPLRRVPELSAALSEYADTVLKAENKEWWLQKKGQLAGGQDNSFNYARGLYEIVNNEKFMKKYGNSPVWQDAKKFTDIRNAVVFAYKSLPSGGGRKTALKEAYLDYLATSITTFHPKIQEIIKRYFEDDTMKVVTD